MWHGGCFAASMVKAAKISLRVLLLGGRRPQTSRIEEAITAISHRVVATLAPDDDLVVMAQRMQPDAIVIEVESPTRDLLHSLQMLNERQPLPIVVFADRSDDRDIRLAVRAGTSAYVVDGLEPHRVGPVLEAAIVRFIEFETLRAERDEAVAKLSERRAIERAKGILMRRRDLAEDAAYEVLRKMSSNRGRRMLEVAESIITAEEALTAR